MKTASDPRHKLRRKVVKELFANEFTKQKASTTTLRVINKSVKIDEMITKSAGQGPIEKINKIDLAILRLAVWEIMENKTPKKVIVDEAVELAKEYGSEASPSFVNGVLGSILKLYENH